MNHSVEILMYVMSIFFIVAIALTTLLYFFVRKKYSYKKWTVEIIFMTAIVIISTLFKYLVFMYVSEGEVQASGWDGYALFIKSLYTTVGGLTWEGLADGGHEPLPFRLAYYASSIYAGVMTIIIISATASYEWYSRLSLIFGYEKDKNIYVFTAVNDEALEMAENIKKTKSNAKIVFAGASIDAFDRKDELCRKIMASGFLYWSYSKDKKHLKSIAKTLLLNNSNSDDYDKDFVIFAFDTVDHIPVEEDNLDVVFDDIKARIEQDKDDGLRIEYILLSKRNVNYQAYESANNRMKEAWEKTDKSQGVQYSERFVLDVWNEAQVSARRGVRKLMDVGMIDDIVSGEKGDIRVWSLGFGGVAEAITNEIFVATPGFVNGNARGYSVEVYDTDVEQVEGLFRFKHPTYAYCEVGETERVAIADKRKELGYSESMPCPVYTFNGVNCLGRDFSVMADSNDNGNHKNVLTPDVIVIATGDDYRNVSIANALIQDLVNENAHKKQYVMVNIFDDHNNNLISTFGNKFDENGILKINDKLTVIIVGNMSDTYDYASYVEYKKEGALKNWTYGSVDLTGIDGDINRVFSKKIDGETITDADLELIANDISILENKLKGINQEQVKDAMKKFYALDMWSKESNYSVVFVGKLYGKTRDSVSLNTMQEIFDWYYQMSQVEHDRWTRSHLSDGWVYKKQKNKKHKQHNCLIEFDKLDINTIAYDTLNVVWGEMKF